MAITFDGKEIATTETGFLENADDWSEALAEEIAKSDGVELTERHWDVINFLRDQYFNNNNTQPNTRTMVKAMSAQWGEKIAQKDLYQLYPRDPSKQAGRIAGLPESRRKGGY